MDQVKGTRFQTRSILAFNSDYHATKLGEQFSRGSNADDLRAQYVDAPVALKPPAGTTRTTERRSSGTDEFAFVGTLI